VTLLIAHRGASARFAENTAEAFEGARTFGADWVELDVRLLTVPSPSITTPTSRTAARSSTSTPPTCPQA
jgi:hypothetical protein